MEVSSFLKANAMYVVSAGPLTLDLETDNMCELTSSKNFNVPRRQIHRRPEARARRP